jgi:hypothetical protein
MLAAPFYVACGLLVASGVAKLWRPAPAISALEAAHLRGGAVAARALGIVEIAVGALGLWRPSAPTAAAVAVLYLGFALFLVRLIRQGNASTCGCVGSREAPPSSLHVALDLIAVVVTLAVAVAPVAPLAATVDSSPFAGVPLIVGLVGAGALLAVAAAEVPRAWRSYRPAHEQHAHGASPAGPWPIALVERPR